MLGIRHLRGRIMPVLDGRRRLGLTDMPPQNPEQVRVITIGDDEPLIAYARGITDELRGQGVRVVLDDSSDPIRSAQELPV